MNKPRILVISHEFWPWHSPNSRILHLILSRIAADFDIDVVAEAVDRSGLQSVDGIRVWRVSGIRQIVRQLIGRGQHRSQLVHTATSRASFLNRFLSALWWPDHCFLWMPAAKRMIRTLGRAASYQWIVSQSHPFTNHLLARWATRRLRGPRWLMYMNDPFRLSRRLRVNNPFLYGGLNGVVERACIAEAARLVVSTELGPYYRSVPGAVQLRLPVIDRLEAPESAEATHGEPLVLLHLGSLYRELRNPTFYLDTSRGLVSRRLVRLVFFGDVSDCAALLSRYKREYGEGIHLAGYVDKREADRVAREADVLVNISNDTDLQMPSKLLEYMALGKPVVNFVYRHDVTSAYVNEYRRGITIAMGDRDASSRLEAFLFGPWPEANTRFLKEHTSDYGAARFRALLED